MRRAAVLTLAVVVLAVVLASAFLVIPSIECASLKCQPRPSSKTLSTSSSTSRATSEIPTISFTFSDNGTGLIQASSTTTTEFTSSSSLSTSRSYVSTIGTAAQTSSSSLYETTSSTQAPHSSASTAESTVTSTVSASLFSASAGECLNAPSVSDDTFDPINITVPSPNGGIQASAVAPSVSFPNDTSYLQAFACNGEYALDAYWFSEYNPSNGLWAQMGFYTYGCWMSFYSPVTLTRSYQYCGESLFAFYQVWNLTSYSIVASLPTLPVTVGNTYTFAMKDCTGTVWCFYLNGAEFASFDMGAATLTYDGAYQEVHQISSDMFTLPGLEFFDVTTTAG